MERQEEAIFHLKDLRDKTQKIYDKIRNDQAPAQEIRQRLDGCDVMTQTLGRKSFRSHTAVSRNEEDKESLRSRSSKAASTRSHRSRISWSSKASLIDIKKADADADHNFLTLSSEWFSICLVRDSENDLYIFRQTRS